MWTYSQVLPRSKSGTSQPPSYQMCYSRPPSQPLYERGLVVAVVAGAGVEV